MTTISRIASQLGVSTATVSRALNDKPGVSENIRQRVLRLASEMKYTPNMAARSLVSAATLAAGFLIYDRALPLIDDPFYLHVLRGAEQEFSRRGYVLIVSSVHDAAPQAEELAILRQKRVDGLILAGPFFPQRFILALVSIGIPLVLVDNALQQTPLNCILIDDDKGAYDATRHLLAHGHRKIAMLSGPQAWVSIRARAAGYRRAMEEAGLTAHIQHMPETTCASGHYAMLQALQNDPGLTAVFAANDVMALGAMRAAQEQGRTLPGDLAIVGFDDVEAASHAFPSLTTMRVPKRLLGVHAARRLIDILENKEEPPVTCTVAVELVVRHSCGCQENNPS